MFLPLGPKSDLQHLIVLARQKRAQTMEARLLSIAAYIEELEAQIEIMTASHQRGGQARANGMTSDERRQLGRRAADRRWACQRAGIESEKLFTP